MKIADNIPIIIVMTALLVNIAIGVRGGIGFSLLMIRCIIVTIVFGIFGHLITETVKNAVDSSRISKSARKMYDASASQDSNQSSSGNKPLLDIKVPPLQDHEFLNMNKQKSEDGFVEMNPVYMGKYMQDEQD